MHGSHWRLWEAGGRVRGWRLCTVASLTMFLTGICSGVCAGPSPSAVGEFDEQLSPTEISALHGGASKYPYATLALLYLLGSAPSDRDGSLYVDSIPPDYLSDLLQRSADRDGISVLFATLQWSPYSSAESCVRVSWSVRYLTSGASVVQFGAVLVGYAGISHHPSLESATAVLSEDGSVLFLDPALVL